MDLTCLYFVISYTLYHFASLRNVQFIEGGKSYIYNIIYTNTIIMNKAIICYTGIGSVKTGNHTQKQYLEVMNNNFKKECAVYIKLLKCKSCKKSREIISKHIKQGINAELKNKTYKMTNKTEKKLITQLSKCKRCKNNKTKKCNLNNYLLFSGADLGKCEK